MEELNTDCLIYIFQFLPICDRVKIERVCRRWKEVGVRSWYGFRKLDSCDDLWGYQSSQIKKDVLEKVLTRCGKYLTELTLNGALETNPVNPLSDLCQNLRSVSLDFNNLRLDDDDLRNFLTNSKKLTSLALSWLPDRYDDAFLKNIVFSGCSLKQFKLGYCCGVTGDCFSKLGDKIEEVHLMACINLRIRVIFGHLSEFKSLKRLGLVHCLEPSDGSANFFLSWVKRMKLESLDISNNEYFVDDDLLYDLSRSCTTLTSLNISKNYFKVTDSGLQCVFKIPQLEHLSMENLWRVNCKFSPNLPRLKSLICCENKRLSEGFFEGIFSSARNLELLDVRYCSSLDESFIKNYIGNGGVLKIMASPELAAKIAAHSRCHVSKRSDFYWEIKIM